jgi:hypothetical protein
VDQELPEVGASVTLLIRPGAASLRAPDDQDAENLLRAEITAVSFRGKYYQVWMKASQETLMFELPALSADVNEQITFTLDPRAIGLFPS